MINSGSTLLQLPGELRNAIYAYALTMDNDILYFENTSGCGRLLNGDYWILPRSYWVRVNSGERHPKVFREVNQLKFVNRQLYHETKTLTMKHNVLSFSSAKLLASFISRFPAAEEIRCLTLHNAFHSLEYRGGSAARRRQALVVGQILDFCRKAPNTLIRCISKVLTVNDFSVIRRIILGESVHHGVSQCKV